MSVIMSKDKKKIIKTLKGRKEHVFKITKEIIYTIPDSMVSYYSDYKDFLKFAKEYPDKVFMNCYQILTEVKEIKEL